MPPPPPSTPLAPSPILKLKRAFEAGFVPAEEDTASDPSSWTARAEMRERRDERERAAVVLGSWQQLAWHSHMYGEKSVPQTRLRFEKILIGLEVESGEEEWEDEGEEGEKGRERGKKEEKQKKARRRV